MVTSTSKNGEFSENSLSTNLRPKTRTKTSFLTPMKSSNPWKTFTGLLLCSKKKSWSNKSRTIFPVRMKKTKVSTSTNGCFYVQQLMLGPFPPATKFISKRISCWILEWKSCLIFLPTKANLKALFSKPLTLRISKPSTISSKPLMSSTNSPFLKACVATTPSTVPSTRTT